MSHSESSCTCVNQKLGPEGKQWVEQIKPKIWELPDPKIRQFSTGATRDTEENKLDYEGFLSPDVLELFAKYMQKHRKQSDGSLRSSDNWQKGIPKDVYMKSMWRHFHSFWKSHRSGDPNLEDLMGLMFNVQGYAHEQLKDDDLWLDQVLGDMDDKL